MKTQPDDSPQDLKRKARYTKKKKQNVNHTEKTALSPDDVLTPGYEEHEGERIDKSTQRVLELNRKGIFACPKFTRFFNDDEEDTRIV